MPKRKKAIAPKEDAASFGYIGGLIGGFVAYLVAEITLAVRPHPIHWLVGLTGAIAVGAAAYGVTFMRQRRR